MGHPVDHYLDDFFGVVLAGADPAQPLCMLALACSALGLQLVPQKTFWGETKLEILGIEIDTVQQCISITNGRHQHILDAIDGLLACHSARLINWQCIAGLLQFVSQVVPHMLKLRWWQSTLQMWPGHSLLQPSPLVVKYIWTNASKWSYEAHLGPMQAPTVALSQEVPPHHQSKDIWFLEALAVLEVLHAFSPSWTSPSLIVLHMDNTNVEWGLHTSCSCDPLTQTLLLMFSSGALAPLPSHLRKAPGDFVAATGCFPLAANYIWQGLAKSSQKRSAGVPDRYRAFVHRHFGPGTSPFPASDLFLTEWVYSPMAIWNKWFMASSTPTASSQQCPSCTSPSHFSRPSSHSSGPCPLVPGTISEVTWNQTLLAQLQVGSVTCRRVTGSYGRSTGIEDLVDTSREHGRSAVSMETMDSYGLTCKGEPSHMRGGPGTATRRTKLKEQAQPRRGPSSDGYHSGARETRVIGHWQAGPEEEEQCRRSQHQVMRRRSSVEGVNTTQEAQGCQAGEAPEQYSMKKVLSGERAGAASLAML
ncbi:hypothetical protein NDA10_005269 [Ustilago hordei]|nr:hypothetical protein NDA10_005269 [Ustilago hordei]